MTDKPIPNPDILDSIKAEMYTFEKNDIAKMSTLEKDFKKIYQYDKLVVGIGDDTKRQEQSWHILRTQILVNRSKKKKFSPSNRTPSAKESITITEENIKILKDANLLVNLKDEIQETVVREDDTIIAVTTTQGLSKVKNREATSDNLLITSKSRAGKDFFVESCYKVLVPKGQYYRRSRISKTTFTYWHTADDDWDWTDKYIHLEDIETDVINCEVMRTMTSNFGGTATIVVKQKAVDLTIKGKPGIICTAYNIVITEEIRNRFNVTEMDESEEQTWLIKQRQAKIANGTYAPKVNEALRSSYHRLPKVEVVVPFSEALYDLLPNTVAMRTIYNTLLDFVKAPAQQFQYLREKTPDGKVIATWDDYFIARIAFMKTHGIGGISFTKADKKVIEYLRKNGLATIPTLIEEIPAVTHYYCYTLKGLDNLTDLGVLICSEVIDEASHRFVNHYELADKNAQDIYLPLFPEGITVDEKIKQIIIDILDAFCNNDDSKIIEIINVIKSNHKSVVPNNSSGLMTFISILKNYIKEKDTRKGLEEREKRKKKEQIKTCDTHHKIIRPDNIDFCKEQEELMMTIGFYEKMVGRLFVTPKKRAERARAYEKKPQEKGRLERKIIRPDDKADRKF